MKIQYNARLHVRLYKKFYDFIRWFQLPGIKLVFVQLSSFVPANRCIQNLTVHLFSQFESMKQIFALFLFSFVTADENSIGKCSFSRDCQQYTTCQRIQDAGCICNFGSCIISGNPFFRGSECDDYTDCACKYKHIVCL